MKSVYDFMSKICPWAPLKLTHAITTELKWYVSEEKVSLLLLAEG